MTKEETIAIIKMTLFEVLRLPDGTCIDETSSLRDDLGIDSMSSLALLVKLENHIPGFNVDPETLEEEDLSTVFSVYNYIQRTTN
jgi:acyl carrier protein